MSANAVSQLIVHIQAFVAEAITNPDAYIEHKEAIRSANLELSGLYMKLDRMDAQRRGEAYRKANPNFLDGKAKTPDEQYQDHLQQEYDKGNY